MIIFIYQVRESFVEFNLFSIQNLIKKEIF